MNSMCLFIPLAVYLLLALGGLACAIVAPVLLKKTSVADPLQPPQGSQPPLLPGATLRPAASRRFWTLCLKSFFVLGLAAFVAGFLGAWSTGVSIGYEPNPVVEWSDRNAPELEPLIRKHCVPFLNQGKSIGLAVAVVTPTNSTIMTFGHPSLASSARTRADTFFEIGSITKTFTGLALAREIDQGLVRLDQPVQELLPPGVPLPEEARGVTLRQLTTHSSGFPRLAANQSKLRGIGMLLFGSDPYASYTVADLMEGVRTVKLEFKPGTRSSYSNFGMTLLGYLLARKAGSTWEALVKQQVCLPLGLRDTTATLDAFPSPARRASLPCRVALRARLWWPCVRTPGLWAMNWAAPARFVPPRTTCSNILRRTCTRKGSPSNTPCASLTRCCSRRMSTRPLA